MQRIPQRLIVGVLVIAAVTALIVTNNLAAEAGLPIVLGVAASLGVGYEVGERRGRKR